LDWEGTVRGGRIFIAIATIGLGVKAADVGLAFANDLTAEVAAPQIQSVLSGIVAATGVRLSSVRESLQIYAELEHQGYLRKAGVCEARPARSEAIACTYELTDRGQTHVAPEASAQIKRASMYSCAGVEGCTEVTWIIGRYKLSVVTGIAMERNNEALVEYVLDAELSPIATILYPAMSSKLTTPHTAVFRNVGDGWQLAYVGIGRRN
jgi:hypothetical protein